MSEKEKRAQDQLPEDAPPFVRAFFEFINNMMRHAPDLTPLAVADAARAWVRTNFGKENIT